MRVPLYIGIIAQLLLFIRYFCLQEAANTRRSSSEPAATAKEARLPQKQGTLPPHTRAAEHHCAT